MNESIASAFLDELDKIGVTQAWVRKRMRLKPSDKVFMVSGKKYRGVAEKKLAQGVWDYTGRPIAELFGLKGDNLREFKIGIREGAKSTAKESAGVHVPTGPTVIGPRGGRLPREVFHHEMFHKKVPVLGRFEAPAYLYGALKGRGKGKLKYALRAAFHGAKQDISPRNLITGSILAGLRGAARLKKLFSRKPRLAPARAKA